MTLSFSVSDIQQQLHPYRHQKIGFVPTMGALHNGHLSLMKNSHGLCDITVVSIFVNSAQFSPSEDFDTYPRQIEKDIAFIKSLKNPTLIFTPQEKDIYPTNSPTTHISVPTLSQQYCGRTRPHFFDGVCAVVNRLFNIVQPQVAFFGEKDFQQLTIIKKMVHDLFMPITIKSCPIIRESNGVAMSSRNRYLSEQEKQEASVIYRSFLEAKQHFGRGMTQSNSLIKIMTQFIHQNSTITIDYLSIVNSHTLKSIQDCSVDSRILFAGYLNKVRLIDNSSLS